MEIEEGNSQQRRKADTVVEKGERQLVVEKAGKERQEYERKRNTQESRESKLKKRVRDGQVQEWRSVAVQENRGNGGRSSEQKNTERWRVHISKLSNREGPTTDSKRKELLQPTPRYFTGSGVQRRITTTVGTAANLVDSRGSCVHSKRLNSARNLCSQHTDARLFTYTG